KKSATSKPEKKQANKIAAEVKEVEKSDQEKKTAAEAPSEQQPKEESGYNPGKARYDPIEDASWSSGQPVPYLALAKTFEAIEATPGRLRILELLCNFLRSVRLLSPKDLLPCVYLCLNQLAPAYEAVELGVGDSVLIKAMALSTGSTVDKIRQRAQVVGDLGAVSESLRSRQAVMCQPKPLTVAGVFQRLREVSKIQSLLVSCRQCEAKYLIRSLSGRLRIGLAELSVLSALGHAFVRSPNLKTPDASRGQSADSWKRRQDEAALLVRTAYCRCPNYDLLVLTTRKRKDADAGSIKVQVCVFVFDILYYNGESLVEKSLRQRRKVLRDGFNFAETEQAGHFALAKWQDCSDTEEIQVFLDEAIRGNCEGLMLKALDTEATYEIAKRSHSWLKLKKDYVDGVGDTLDLVVVGGYHGTGKRAGKLGGFLLACYNPDDEEYQTVCKIGTGFSDEDLDAFTRDLAEHRVAAPKPYVRCGGASNADVWFDPAIVWEVKAADLSLSPAYMAAIGLADPRRGVSLRFPRFVRRREDKRPEEATTAAQLAEMYSSQEVVKSAAATAGGQNEDEDYY
uniref:DNA ligase 1 n=1 Tax=Macrostomum lignano TaxID=282301 RepID=A0A1I8HIP1_9PLAT